MKYLILLTLLLVLTGCSSHRYERNSDDFKPYVTAEMQSIPMPYGDEVWVYPQGTTPAQIVDGWRRGWLVMGASRSLLGGPLVVTVGPNFYSLAPMQQRGLAHAVASMYGVGRDGLRGYLIKDAIMGRYVGSYTRYGLQLY